MPLKSFSISGFKAYAESVSLEMRPLTLLYGENSSGKSSLMRILPLIFHTVSNPGEMPLTLSPALTKSASIEDLFSKFRDDRVMELKLTFAQDDNSELQLRYVIRHVERQRTLLMEFSIDHNGASLNVELDISSLAEGQETVSSGPSYVNKDVKNIVEGLSFVGLTPHYTSTIDPPGIRSLVNLAISQLEGIRCHWLAPLRASVPRISRVFGRSTGVGSYGEGALEVLYTDFLASGPIFHDVSDWFRKNTNSVLDVVPGAHEFGALAGLALVHQGTQPVRIPIEDCGEGITQVLPVLVLAAMAKHGHLGNAPFVVVEHPDLHLHNSAHFGIIEFFVEAGKSPSRPVFLMESHSESMLVAAQIQIADKHLTPNQLGAYHIDTNASGQSSAALVTFDENARPNGGYGALDWFARANQRSLELARRMVKI